MSKSSKFTQATVAGEVYKGGRTERDFNGIPYIPAIGVGMTMSSYYPMVDVMEDVWVRVAEVFKDSGGTYARLQWKDAETGEIFEEIKLTRYPDGRAVNYTECGLNPKKKPLIKVEPGSGDGSAA